MNLSHLNRSLFLLVIFYLQINSSFSQNVEFVRYSMTPNMLIDLKTKYPEKENRITQSLEKLPQFIDFYLIDSNLIQVSIMKDSSFSDIIIFNKSNDSILCISNNLTIKNIELLRLKDTIPINWVKDSNDFLYSDFNKKGVFPLRFIVEDTSKNINGTLTNYFVDFPEVSFVLDFNYFPDQIIYGKPKMLKSYKNEKLLIKLNYTFTSMLFYDFINNPNSEKKKKAFVSWFGN